MRIPLRPAIGVIATLLFLAPGALAQEAQAPVEADMSRLPDLINWQGMLVSLFVITVSWLLLRFVDSLIERLATVIVKRRLLFQKVNAIFQFIVYLAVIVAVVLLSFNFSKEVLTFLGGGVAVAIGFSMKDLVASLVAGIMIMVDRPFQLGDRVNFGGQYGDIIKIGLRSVKLQTLEDSTVTIPNSRFLNDISSSGNYGALDMLVSVDFHIGVDQDASLAQELMREIAITSRFVYLPKPIVICVSPVVVENYVALKLKLKVYVLDTLYEKDLETDVTLRVLAAFTKNGILPPAILHRSIRNLAGTEGGDLNLVSQPA